MTKDWLTRYDLQYPRSLIYMLQASEYNIRDYLRWLARTKDFAHVEKRKQLVKNKKTILLLVIAWIISLTLYILAIYILFTGTIPLKYIEFFAIILVAPYIVAYGIILPLTSIKFLIQKPIEYFIIKKAKQILVSHKGFKIAIAGSYGKTTMREILKTVLSEDKKVATPPGNHNTPLGISTFIKSLAGDEDILIFELGEYYPGDVKKLCTLVRPDLGIITGVNEAHLEKFKTIDKTARTIFELADYLGDKPLYVNKENTTASQYASPSHILYSREKVGKWFVSDPTTDLTGTSFILKNNSETLAVHSRLLGSHQIGPLAVAIDIAICTGMAHESTLRGIAHTKPCDHRLEPKIDSSGVITLDDSYNGNPDGVSAVIEFLSSLKDYHRLYVTPGLVEMGAQTESIHKKIGHQLASADIEKVVLIKNSVTPFIEQGLKESKYHGEIIWFKDALTAFASLSQLTVPGDVVLLQNDWPDQYN
ncbi:MAG: Mur ligase family protein [bacterium]|nr:Mur ligase family protein [bacterium]